MAVSAMLVLVDDICVNDIDAAFRKHVLADLQPYICLSETCDVAHVQYASRAEWSSHEVHDHCMETRETDVQSIDKIKKQSKCPFCTEGMEPRNNHREQHIGRHMEEVAFAIVTKPYKYCDFYSNSSS